MPVLTFHSLANEDFEEAYDWYEEREANLGERFGEAIKETLDRIEKTPQLFRIVKQNFREASVRVFPYSIVYRFNKKQDRIFIAAIYHAKRDPKKKFRR